mmetsp:Transcript_62053/g.140367  ORF Transcript_62053/g.140367 Transcript_62053/m.140367 type:complete len:250 (+) Transcript_62053:869-1618(+)
MYGRMRTPLRHHPHRGGVRVLIADVRLSSPFVASRRFTPSDVPGGPVAPPINSTVLQRPPFRRTHPIRSPRAGRRPPRDRPPRRRLKIFCSSAICCSGGAGDRPGVCVDVPRRCTSPVARDARAAWPRGRREVLAACGLRRTRRRPIAVFPILCSHPSGLVTFRGPKATVHLDGIRVRCRAALVTPPCATIPEGAAAAQGWSCFVCSVGASTADFAAFFALCMAVLWARRFLFPSSLLDPRGLLLSSFF